jgi:hypothetical protein
MLFSKSSSSTCYRMTLKTLGFHKAFYYLTRREILNHCPIEKTITTWAWCPIHPRLLVPEVPSREHGKNTRQYSPP